MITDEQTNSLYLADCLSRKYPDFFRHFIRALKNSKTSFRLIPDTKDVWVKDFMPVQISRNQFVRFRYEPNYLMKSHRGRSTISDTGSICTRLHISSKNSGINLDGGNITKTSSSAILSDKLFDENPGLSEAELIIGVKKALSVRKIIIIPSHPMDFTGHADGMIRFYKRNTVLVNDYSIEKSRFGRYFKMALYNAGFQLIEIPYNPYTNKSSTDAAGEYLNFLLMKQALFIPVFGLAEDKKVINIFHKLFPGKPIFPVPCNDLASDGGALNCVSWNIIE